MKLMECFTLDHSSRSGRLLPLREIIWELIFGPGFRVVVYYRISLYLRRRRFPRRLCGLIGRLILVRLARVPGVEIRTTYEIGEGLLIYHPHDIVIGAGVRIGRNVTIYNGVTLGARSIRTEEELKEGRYPVISDNVVIFSGAKIIGNVSIGNACIIGANSVVTRSFPAGSVIAGSPARKLEKHY